MLCKSKQNVPKLIWYWALLRIYFAIVKWYTFLSQLKCLKKFGITFPLNGDISHNLVTVLRSPPENLGFGIFENLFARHSFCRRHRSGNLQMKICAHGLLSETGGGLKKYNLLLQLKYTFSVILCISLSGVNVTKTIYSDFLRKKWKPRNSVTGWVCEKNRPKCNPFHFFSKWIHNLYRRKK
jgi:hypothetical protein